MAYATKQQQAVLAVLAQRQHLPPMTAGELAEALRSAGSPVGLATIYRQLEKLESVGRIHKISTEEGAFYQYCDGSGHRDCFLLKCEGCGRILHLDCTHLQPLYQHLEQQHHFIINPRATLLAGLCDVCAAKREETCHGDH